MMAFVFLSGYLYKDTNSNVIRRIWKEIKRLIIPMSIFTVLFVWVNHEGVVHELKNLLLGMSFSNKIFSEVKTIGPFYFVLLLFIVKIIYIFTNNWIRNNSIATLIYIILALIGTILGENGYWLPWSIDVALYGLIFFHMGHVFKKYDLINKLMDRKYLYFVLSPIWCFMIYSGGMEIATRKYQPFGLIILGTLSGVLIMYMLSNSISHRIGKIGNKFTSLIGSSTIYILMIHALFNAKIINLLNDLGLDYRNIYNFSISLCVQIIGGIMMFFLIKFLQSQFKEINLKMRYK